MLDRKMLTFAAVLIACLGLGCGGSGTQDAPAESENGMPESEYEVEEVYADLRNQILDLDPLDFPFRESGMAAVVMETGFPQAVVSLVATADGTASLYFSSGGGILGAGEHDEVRRAAESFLEAATRVAPLAAPAESYPLPGKKKVRFYMVTDDGVVTIEARQDNLENGRHELAPLFRQGHALIAAIRMATPR